MGSGRGVRSKHCPHCGETKLAEMFYSAPSREDRDGLSSLCRQCSSSVAGSRVKRLRKLYGRNKGPKGGSYYRYSAKWKKENRDRMAGYVRRWRARRAAAPLNDLTHNQWREIVERYNGRCIYCGEIAKPVTQDHMIPLSRGGAHTASNVIPACRLCNSRKSARTVEEFMAGRVGITKKGVKLVSSSPSKAPSGHQLFLEAI